MLTCNDKHTVSAALTGKRCAGSTKSEGQLILGAQLHDSGYLIFTIATNHYLGYLAIKTGISTPT